MKQVSNDQRYEATHQMVTPWLVQETSYYSVLICVQSLRRWRVSQFSCTSSLLSVADEIFTSREHVS